MLKKQTTTAAKKKEKRKRENKQQKKQKEKYLQHIISLIRRVDADSDFVAIHQTDVHGNCLRRFLLGILMDQS